MSESILANLSQLNKDDFKDLVALGTFASYENRVYLAGPCNSGKSSLASILIGETIPRKWFSTDGLIIHFGRNGIDLLNRKMIALKKGAGGVLTKLLLGNPELNEQYGGYNYSHTQLNKMENKDEARDTSLQNQKNVQPLPKNQHGKAISTSKQIPSKIKRNNNKKEGEVQDESDQNVRDMKYPSVESPKLDEPDPKASKSSKIQLVHTSHSIQQDILDKIKKKSYVMNIAPSDLVDFGGQKSFDMTHQLFIQHKGTFILMFDGRKGLNTALDEYPQGNVTAGSILEHWINSVLTYCNKSDDEMPRIIFAATHSDMFSEEGKKELSLLFREELTKMFSSHKLHNHIVYDKVFFINAADAADLNIDLLKHTLVDIAFEQSTWGQRMPIVWVPLDLQISDLRFNDLKIITKKRLFEINMSNREFALTERRVEDFLTCSALYRKVIILR